MKCPSCNTDIADSAKKCPFCKELVGDETSQKFRNFNFKYTITSQEQIKIIRDTVNELSENVAAENAKMPQTEKKHKTKITIRRRRKSVKENAEPCAENDKPLNNTDIGKEKKPHRFGEMSQAKKLRIGIWGVMIAAILLIIGVVCGVVSLIGAYEADYNAYVYSKDNELYAVHEGKSIKISSSAVDESYLTKMSVYEDKVSTAEILNRTKTYTISQNGRYIYYLENFEPEKACGDLYRIEKGKPATKLKIAGSANNSLVLSEKGDRVLFLCSTDENGNMGALYFWEKGLREPYKITTDIDSGTFCFSKDGKRAVFIQNLDRQIMQGDLYVKELERLKEEREQLDSGVCEIFGTTENSEYYIYGKNYDVNDKSFEAVAIGGKHGLLSLGGRTRTAPMLCGKKNAVYILEASADGTNVLCKTNVANGKKETVTSGVTALRQVSDNGKMLLFDKVYTGNTAELYTYTAGKQPQKTAENIIADEKAAGGLPQFAYTPDLKTFVYISDYSEERGGILYRVRGGAAAERLAENVYSCYMGSGGRIVYSKDFAQSRGTADIYAVNGGKTILLKKDVNPNMIVTDELCKSVFCISGYEAQSGVGTLEAVDEKADAAKLDSEVFGIDAGKNGELLFYKNLDTENGGSFELYLIKKGKTEPIRIDKGVYTVGLS